jgi:uncharacterized protein YgbK (DUF1537 family)
MLHKTPHALHQKPNTLIAVVADDFTGAAEIAGVALRHGFKAMVSTSLIAQGDADVLIIATDTRAENQEQARATIRKLTLQLLDLKPAFIFKKIDSVLRGNVAAELLEQLQVSDKPRALIIPANPSLNRIIENGIYYCDGVQLNRANFTTNANGESDSSNVIELLGKGFAKDATVISKGDQLPDKGLIVGNTVHEEDLDHWAKQLDEKTIVAGGSGFFSALLKNKNPKDKGKSAVPPLGKHQLYVCGSAFEGSRQMVAAAKTKQLVAYMPTDLFSEKSNQAKLIEKWANEIVNGLNNNNALIIAVDDLDCSPIDDLAEKISKAFANVIKAVMGRCKIDELFIEGGYTAATIIEQLRYQQFYPVQELAVGVIRMKVNGNNDLFLTLKPGSYKWPKEIWFF